MNTIKIKFTAKRDDTLPPNLRNTFADYYQSARSNAQKQLQHSCGSGSAVRNGLARQRDVIAEGGDAGGQSVEMIEKAVGV